MVLKKSLLLNVNFHTLDSFPRSDYGKSVAAEYLKCFEFQDQSLVESLRSFLSHFSLRGESQERERVMVHFSSRYHECNPTEFDDVDNVHGLTIALLLLNTDLHTEVRGEGLGGVWGWAALEGGAELEGGAALEE